MGNGKLRKCWQIALLRAVSARTGLPTSTSYYCSYLYHIELCAVMVP